MDEPERNPVEALAEEYLDRHRRGENPSIEEYVRRHPEWASEIEDLFPAMLLMEQLKPERTDRTRGDGSGRVEGGLDVDRLGDFRIVREIGRGGMGIVYEAVQESLDRRVALKIFPAGALVSPRKLARFRREARAAANLHHTNIVQVYGVGEQDGLHYYVMQLIEGRGLDEIVASGDRPGPRDAAEIARQAARALEYAHSMGTLHRDVKPGNVLVDSQGTVWLTDFGLAKVLSSEEDLTETGDILGTVRYMPPERFEGRSGESGDIYGLGLTVFELVTGRAAFGDRDRASLIKAVREEGPPPIGTLDPSVPRDLETIVLKATALDPSDRYASARDLAGDLTRFVEDRPILARRASHVERLWRWCRRNRVTAALAATATAAVVMAAIVGWIGYLVTTGALERAEANVGLSLDAFEEIFDTLSGTERVPRPPVDREAPREFVEMQEADAALLESILDFYDRFAAGNETNPRLRLESAKAYRRVGVIREQLGRGEEAQSAFERSIRSLEGLVREFPGESDFRLELAESLSASSLRVADLDEAESRCRRAIEIADEAAKLRGGPPAAETRVVTRLRLVEALVRKGSLESARAELIEAERQRAELIERFGHERRSLTPDVVRAQVTVCELLVREGRAAEAGDLLERSIAEARSLVAERRRGGAAGPMLAGLFERLATVRRAAGDEKGAAEAERRAAEHRNRRGGRRAPHRAGKR